MTASQLAAEKTAKTVWSVGMVNAINNVAGGLSSSVAEASERWAATASANCATGPAWYHSTRKHRPGGNVPLTLRLYGGWP